MDGAPLIAADARPLFSTVLGVTDVVFRRPRRQSSREDHFLAAHDREHRARHVQVDAVAIELRRQAIEPLANVGAVFCGATTDCASASAGNPKRLTLSNSKAEIERTDTWTVMSCKSFLASLRLLVAPRESFLTRLGPVKKKHAGKHRRSKRLAGPSG